LFDTTVAANIGYGLKLRGQSRVQCELQIQTALEWAQLDHLADRPTHTLSTGERQRIALTRAKLLNPSALLVDEIIANMDTASRARSHELLRDLSQAGVTIVVASHETGQFDDIADAHLVIEDGHLLSKHASADVIPIGRRQRT
ncbi:MAG: ATP-binding cassette domain-containing protein, partial [Gammaproteobacteria bacterium]